MEKKQWIAPSMEVLDVESTMAGRGTTVIDQVTAEDFDITNPS